MKKSIIFAFVAVVAMLATSCKDKVEAPKARFSADVDGLKVTFTNMTKQEATFVWEFGDGQTSTEKSPVHEYAAIGTYTVTLTAENAGGKNSYSEEIVLAPKSIAIDGDFSDWDQAADVAVAVADENSKYEDLYAIKFCTDANYIYFYCEFSNETYDTEDEAHNPIVGNVVDPIDIYLNVDADETTGSNSYLWENSAADLLIEGFWADNYASAGVYTFPADAAQDAWAWVDAEVVGSTETCDKVVLANGHAAIEGKITMALLPIAVKGLKVGVFSSNTDWSESGCLPQTTINDDGTSTPSPLLEVKLH